MAAGLAIKDRAMSSVKFTRTVSNPSSSKPFVSVILPHYNNSRQLSKLLEALEKQRYPQDSFEIIVVDNGSADKVDHLASRFNIRLAFEKDIRGSYAARNKGIQMAKGEILCFTDSDCTPHENWIAEGVKTLSQQDAHLVGGNVIFTFSDKKRAAEYYDAITNMGIEDSAIKRQVAKTANLFIKKQVLEKTGLFPVQLKSGGDIYLTAKAVKNRFRLVYSPGAIVYHPARTFFQLLKKSGRVGAGKAGIFKLLKKDTKKIPKKVFRSRSFLTHLNPLDIKRRLKKNGYQAGFFKFLAILCVSYCYLSTMFLSLLYHLYMKRES
jgi:glycosyltransferase involved in cell wall biosynthesis